MPANYAHYRLGFQSIPALPESAVRAIRKARRMFDVGLHGPDFFFYADIVGKSELGALGSSYHHRSVRELFQNAARDLRLKPSDEGTAYLYGVLGHFCLDTICHPRIRELHCTGAVTHTELETEFDRYLLCLDGKKHPSAVDTGKHIRVNAAQAARIASVYPPVTGPQVERCIRRMRLLSSFFADSGRVKHAAIALVRRAASPRVAELAMQDQPNPRAQPYNEMLLSLYNQAMELYPRLAKQLSDHLHHNAPLGPEFDRTFG